MHSLTSITIPGRAHYHTAETLICCPHTKIICMLNQEDDMSHLAARCVHYQVSVTVKVCVIYFLACLMWYLLFVCFQLCNLLKKPSSWLWFCVCFPHLKKQVVTQSKSASSWYTSTGYSVSPHFTVISESLTFLIQVMLSHSTAFCVLAWVLLKLFYKSLTRISCVFCHFHGLLSPRYCIWKTKVTVFLSILTYFNLKLKRPAVQKKQPHSFTVSFFCCFVCFFTMIYKRACGQGNQIVQFSPL